MAFEVLGNGVLWRGDGETVRIEAWGRGIRVRAAVMAEIRDADFALLDDVPTAGVVRVDGNAATITASGTTVVAEEEVAYHWSAGFHRDRLRLRFQDADGRVVLEEIGDGGSGTLKKYVTESVNEFLAPIRERRVQLAGDMDYIKDVLHEGNRRANEIANATLDEVREAMNMVY